MADYGPKEMSEKDKEFYRKYEEDNMREFRERLAAQRAQNIKDAKAENETPFEKHVLKLILAHRPSFTSKPGMAYLMSAVEEMPEEREGKADEGRETRVEKVEMEKVEGNKEKNGEERGISPVTAAMPPAGKERHVERIILFFDDGTFECYEK